jgi:hypothetical protein
VVGKATATEDVPSLDARRLFDEGSASSTHGNGVAGSTVISKGYLCQGPLEVISTIVRGDGTDHDRRVLLWTRSNLHPMIQ